LFESKVEGGTVRSSMTRGVAAFHVERLGPGQRFLLTLPDAELEVRGTRFVVSIADGKTQGIEVSEGQVALRPQGQPEVLLSAGDRWPADSHRPAVSFLNISPRKDAAPPEPSKPKD
jgi:ferric-dicitrate binding protein FerR (iron transport regulator)